MTKKKHILLVEDDESMGFLLKDSLENYQFKVTHFNNGKKALAQFPLVKFDICILDVMMPIMDGFSLAEEIRKINPNIPLVFLTAKVLKEDRIKGLKLGADDYITKPFSVEELTLRIQAILKRGKFIDPSDTTLSFSTYNLDISNLTLITKEKSIQLTQKELDIMALFVRNPNVLLKREFILQTIWEDDSYFAGRSLDVFISKLRKNFKTDESVTIKNIHGRGYKFLVTD